MKQLLEQIAASAKMDAALEATINQYFEATSVAKNTTLLRPQQYCRRLYFLEGGTVRTFYENKDKDISSWFYKENQFLTSWHAFYSQTASFEGIETTEACQLYSITYDNYAKLMQEQPRFERFGRILAERQIIFLDQYFKGYMFLSAKERYDLLLQYFPDIELRVKLGYIASYLGISQETFSRIRRG